jgi:sugar lactone lactonase YvrE
MDSNEVKLLVDAHAEVGEGPSWDARENVLWWVDITGNLVHRYDPATGTDTTIDVGRAVGAAVPRASGGLALAVEEGFAVLDPKTGKTELIAEVEADRPENRMNDAKCDTSGRMWAGTMAYDDSPGAGAFYRLDPDRAVTTILKGVTCSNGTAWSPDDTLMYYIDSGRQQVDVFDYDRSTGGVSNRRKLIDIPSSAGVPDGMTVDAEGHLWVALWGGGAIRRYSPDGKLVKVLAMPVTQPTSMAFAGPDLTDLYITSATEGLSDEARQKDPHAGALFRHRPGVKGLPTQSYRG